MAILKIKNEHMNEHNYVFVHIPKTGGRSVLSAMNIKFHCEHKCIQDYVKELGEDTVRNRFKFTIVRNPWSRAVSWYRFFYNPMPNEVPLTFDQWVLKGNKRNQINPSMKRTKVPLDILSYCRNESGEILMDKFLKFETLSQDFVEIAERFNIPTMLPHIGKDEQSHHIQQKERMMKINKSGVTVPVEKSLNYRDLYISQESIDFIGNLNKELIDKFNYTF